MNTFFFATILALGQADPAAAGAAGAGPASTEERQRELSEVIVEIDTSALVEIEGQFASDKTARYVRTDVVAALQDTHNVAVVKDGAAPTITVTLRWVDQPESIYGLEVTTRRDGEDLRMVETFDCECIDPGLSEAVLKRLPAALAQLREPAESEVDDNPAESNTTPPALPNESTDDGETKAAAVGPLGIVGIVTTVGGLGMAGYGIVQLGRGESQDLGDNEHEGTRRDYRPAGRAWLGAGIGTAVVGATLMIVDLTVLKKRRAKAVSVTPTASPTQVGLTLRGQF